LAVEENPYLYRAVAGKERALMISIFRLQVKALKGLLRENKILTEDKQNRFKTSKQNF
jgi:hypothetical protein